MEPLTMKVRCVKVRKLEERPFIIMELFIMMVIIRITNLMELMSLPITPMVQYTTRVQYLKGNIV